ncbi:MAG: AAA family ATPase [Alphaproteobacteria bacterium]|nr:AAA family ATPase [Alphaproteobacteria bacterium]
MTTSLAQQALFLAKEMLSDARQLEAANCWVPFTPRPTPEELIETDLQLFLLWLFAVDGKIHPGEVGIFNAVLGRQESIVSLTSQMQRHQKTMISFSNQVPFLIECAIQRDQAGNVGMAKRMIEAFETLGLLALAADEQVSGSETEALTGYISRARNVAAAILGPSAQPSAPSQPLNPPGLSRPVFGKRKPIMSEGVGSAAPAAKLQEAQTGDSLDKCRAELEALIGLASVKNEVSTLVNLLRVRQLRQSQGMPAPDISLHLVFTGNPGTGKTTVARLLGRIYAHMGILSSGVMVETDRSGLVGQYIGQTEVKTREAIEKAMGGILFIDEAYALAKNGGGSNDFGNEAIAVLLKAMEDRRGNLAVIVAGYSKPMEGFIEANPGLRSRFSRYFNFPDYEPADLLAIFEKYIREGGYRLAPEARQKAEEMFKTLHQRRDRNFGNGRTVRNAFEAALTGHANRLAANAKPSREDLTLLRAEDIATPMS